MALLAGLLAVLGLLLLYSTGSVSKTLPKSVRAPATPAASPDTGALFSLTVSPARVVMPSGLNHQEGTFQVSNSGGEDLDVTVVTGELSQLPDGSVAFGRASRGSAASWVVASPLRFSLKPQQVQVVSVTIDIPTVPEPGEHQVGISFLVPFKGSSETFTINRGIGTQLLIGVPGPVLHKVDVSSLAAPWFSDSGSVPLTLTIRNQGTVHEDYYQPHGILGSANAGSVSFPDFSVLRQTVRTVHGQWDNPPLLCWCSLRVYGDDGNGRVVSASTRVFVFPFRLAVGLLIAMIGLYIARSELRNRRAISRAEAEASLQAKLEAARLQGFEGAASESPVPSQPAAGPL